MKIREQYKKLKYELPKFEDLDREFDLSSVEESPYPLRQVRKRISEVVETHEKIVEEMVNPESNMGSLYECKILDEAKKESLFRVYRKLMRLLRYSLEVSLKNTEAEDVKFINSSFMQWPQVKKELLPMITELKELWDKDKDIKEVLEYFG